VVKNPHGLHLSNFRFSAKARLIVRNRIISRPQTGQMTSFVDKGLCSLIRDCRLFCTRWRTLALISINGRGRRVGQVHAGRPSARRGAGCRLIIQRRVEAVSRLPVFQWHWWAAARSARSEYTISRQLRKKQKFDAYQSQAQLTFL
jgi:hypothetical protein